MWRKHILILTITIISSLAVNTKAAGILDDKRAVFSKIDAGRTAELDSSINALKTTYANDASGLSWALVHIAQYLDEKGNTAKANEIRQQVISQYPGTEQAEAAKIRILGSKIFKLLDSENYSKADELINQLQTDYKNNSATLWALEGIANKFQRQDNESRAVEIRKLISISCKDAELAKIVNERLTFSEQRKIFTDDCNAKLKVIFDLIDNKQYDFAQNQTSLFSQSCRELRDFSWRLIEVAERFANAGQTDRANVIYLEIITDTSQPVAAGYAAAKLYNAMGSIQQGNKPAADNAIEQLRADYAGKDILTSALFFIAEEFYKKGQVQSNSQNANSFYQSSVKLCDEVLGRHDIFGLSFEKDTHIVKSYSCYQLGDFKKSYNECDFIINKWPNSHNIYYLELLKVSCLEKLAENKAIDKNTAYPEMNEILLDVLSEKNVESQYIARAYFDLGKLYYNLGDFDMSLSYLLISASYDIKPDQMQVVLAKIEDIFKAQNRWNLAEPIKNRFGYFTAEPTSENLRRAKVDLLRYLINY